MKEVEEANKPASKYSEIGMANRSSGNSNQAVQGSGEENNGTMKTSEQLPSEPKIIGAWQRFENEYIKPTFVKEPENRYSYEGEQPLSAANQNAQL